MWELRYSELINKILHSGEKRPSRAGNTYSLFGEAIVIDSGVGFPLLHGRKMHYKGVLGELAAFLRGPKNISDFQKFGCNFWDSWGFKSHPEPIMDGKQWGDVIPKEGDLTLDYGNAWLDFNGVNQLAALVDKLTNNPHDRRMVISNWRPDRLAELSLPCCHMFYQWYVRDGKYLDMIWYQRSVDTMVGLPSNIISAATWNIILAQQCGYTPGLVKMMLGDTHIYENHVTQTLDYLRQLKQLVSHGPVPIVNYAIDRTATVSNFKPEMFTIDKYEPMPNIKFELNV